MLVLLCRNRVKDFNAWKRIFDVQCGIQKDAGLRLTNLWRDTEDPNNVFFLFEVSDRQRALDMLNAPESAEIGRQSGVIDGECHFLED